MTNGIFLPEQLDPRDAINPLGARCVHWTKDLEEPRSMHFGSQRLRTSLRREAARLPDPMETILLGAGQ